MSAVIGILILVFVLPYLASRVSHARNAAWAGPRTPAMRGRAVKAPSPVPGTARKAARSAGSAALHPGNRQIRAQAKADAFTAWQQAFATDYLEQQRHHRANGTAPAATATAARPTVAQRLRLKPYTPAPASPASGGSAPGGSAPGGSAPSTAPPPSSGTPARPVPPPPAQPSTNGGTMPPNLTGRHTGPGFPDHTFGECSPGLCGEPAGNLARKYGGAPAPASTNGGTVSAGTSTASAEKAIEGVNELHAHAVSGGIHAKQEGLKSIHEVAVRAAGMVVTLARQMSEPGMNYGPEITEPLATAGNHFQAGATTVSESDAAISTLINMTVGDLASSARQAPHHNELSENGSR